MGTCILPRAGAPVVGRPRVDGKSVFSSRTLVVVVVPSRRLLRSNFPFRYRPGNASIVCAAYNSSRRPRKRKNKAPPPPQVAADLLRQYALPAFGVLAAGATLIGPLIGAVVLTAFGFAAAFAAAAIIFSLSWIFVPVILSVMGIPLLLGFGGFFIFAGAAGLLPFLAVIYLATNVAKSWLLAEDYEDDDDEDEAEAEVDARNAIVDVKADTIDEQDNQRELREFDELLRRREKFKSGGGGDAGRF